MATARIISLNPGDLDADATHFQLLYSADQTTWTTYNPGSADVAVSELDADGLYLLDGINSPAGNAAAASYAGNWYRTRQKTAGGYGNWSSPFKVGYEPDDLGPVADVADLLADFVDWKIALDFRSQEEADAYLSAQLTRAMDRLRMDEDIDALYSGSPTAAQLRRLSIAERYQALANIIEKLMVQRATGMHAPLEVEQSVDLERLAEYFNTRVRVLMGELETEEVSVSEELQPVVVGTLVISDPSPRMREMTDLDYWAGV
jgi:hypothetical protein